MLIRSFWAPVRRLAAGIVLLVPLWQSCRFVLDYAGYYDFYVSHVKEPGWVSTMLDWFLNPPPWTLGPAIIVGLALIYWDSKRRQARLTLLPIGSEAPKLNNQFQEQKSRSITNISKEELFQKLESFARRVRSFEESKSEDMDIAIALFDVTNTRVESALLIAKRKASVSEIEDKEREVLALQSKADKLSDARISRLTSEFRAQFLSEAVQLRAELSRRTGRPVGGPDDPTTDLLDNGKFEIDALTTLTNHLHKMADRLPD